MKRLPFAFVARQRLSTFRNASTRRLRSLRRRFRLAMRMRTRFDSGIDCGMAGMLVNMKTTATGPWARWRFAWLVLAAGCCHLSATRATEVLLTNYEAFAPRPSELVFVTDEPSEYDPPLFKFARVEACTATITDCAGCERLPSPLLAPESVSPSSIESEPEEKRSWIPQGVIPYFGPRTPDSQKDRGIGGPLESDGWRSRQFSISGFSGFSAGGALIPGHVHQEPSYYGGINVAWDYDHFWGFEKRLGFGALNLTDANHDPIRGTNLSITGEYRLMYYPLGDARWRPFVTSGLGWSDFYFDDDHGDKHLDTVGMVPYGLGVKYLHNENIALRIDVVDELTIGAGSLSTFHYVAMTAGLEVRYGRRLLKMPWHHDDSGN